jgi:hypothetical protein
MTCIPKQVADQNTQYACGEMRKLGIVPKRAVILADDLQDIAQAVREMSQSYTAVITMGGIGKIFAGYMVHRRVHSLLLCSAGKLRTFRPKKEKRTCA